MNRVPTFITVKLALDAVAQGARGEGGEAAPACQPDHRAQIGQGEFAQDAEIARADKVAAARDGELGQAYQTGGDVEEAGARHRSEDQSLDPVQPLLFDDAAA